MWYAQSRVDMRATSERTRRLRPNLGNIHPREAKALLLVVLLLGHGGGPLRRALGLARQRPISGEDADTQDVHLVQFWAVPHVLLRRGWRWWWSAYFSRSSTSSGEPR